MAYPSVSAIEYQSGEAMRRAAVAIHKRLWKPSSIRNVHSVPIPPTVEIVENAPEPIDPVGEYRVIDVYSAYSDPSYPALKGTAKAYLMRRSVELGCSYGQIVGVRRSRAVVKARHQLIAEVYHKFPKLSLPAIGRVFCKDHTSILAALRKMGEHGRSKPDADSRVIEGETRNGV